MIISGLGVDSKTKSPVVILKEIDGERALPIWIGILEAQAIASELGSIKSDRPMPHDLLKTILESVDVKVNKVEICDLKLVFAPKIRQQTSTPAFTIIRKDLMSFV
jgi:bifunctional DNase/RNase